MNNLKQIAINAIQHWIGHETAHLAPTEQIVVFEEIAQSCLDTAVELRAEFAPKELAQ